MSQTNGSAPDSGPDRAGVVRRVVTAIDDSGRSYILADGQSPNRHASESVAGFGAAQVWFTPPGPVSNAGEQDNGAADATIPMHPAVGGSIFRVADFPPDSSYTDEGRSALFGEIGGEDARSGAEHSSDKHFWFHKTDSIDYGIVLEGEIWLVLDDGECLLKTGDVVVQRGTSHAWANRSNLPCRMAFVLIGAPAVPTSTVSELVGHQP